VLNAVPLALGVLCVASGIYALAGKRPGQLLRWALLVAVVAGVGLGLPLLAGVRISARVPQSAIDELASNFDRAVFSPDGQLLAAASLHPRRPTIPLYDTITGQLVRSLPDNPGSVLAFHPDGSRLVTAAGRTIAVWDLASGEKRNHFDRDDAILTMCYLDQGRQLLVVDAMSVCRLDAETGAELSAQQTPQCDRAAIAADGSRVALAKGQRYGSSGEPWVKVWDVSSGEEFWQIPDSELPTGVALSHDGRLLATGHGHYNSGTVHLWDVDARKLVSSHPTATSFVEALTFRADGRYLAAKTGSREVTVWGTNPGSRRFTLSPVPASALAFRGDGQLLATVGQEVLFWDIRRACPPDR
jgi:WD40 repeat protein